jgi:hypothetical protein
MSPTALLLIAAELACYGPDRRRTGSMIKRIFGRTAGSIWCPPRCGSAVTLAPLSLSYSASRSVIAAVIIGSR